MMKSSDEMVKSLLERRERYVQERKKRRKRVIGISVPAGCCALLLCAVFLLPGIRDSMGSAVLPGPTAAPTDSADPETPALPVTDGAFGSQLAPENPEPVTDAGESIQSELAAGTGTDSDGTASPHDLTPKTGTAGSVSYEICYLWWRNKLIVAGPLYWAIEDDPEGTFTVIASYRPITGDITDFTYEGKTLSQWAIEAVEADLLPGKMTELLKMGDELKYGEALYETGTPDGIIWDRRLYEDKVAYYGEELLSRYIVDGEFLREKLEADLADVENTAHTLAEEAYARAYSAYLDEVMPEFVRELTAEGISCDRAPDRSSCLLMTVTAAELESIPLDDPKDWTFDLN